MKYRNDTFIGVDHTALMAMWNCLAHGMANVGPLFEIDGWAIQYCMSRKNSRMSLMEREIAPGWNPTAWSRRDGHQHEPRGKANIHLLRMRDEPGGEKLPQCTSARGCDGACVRLEIS